MFDLNNSKLENMIRDNVRWTNLYLFLWQSKIQSRKTIVTGKKWIIKWIGNKERD